MIVCLRWRPWWMETAPGQTVVAVDGETILGSAKVDPTACSRSPPPDIQRRPDSPDSRQHTLG